MNVVKDVLKELPPEQRAQVVVGLFGLLKKLGGLIGGLFDGDSDEEPEEGKNRRAEEILPRYDFPVTVPIDPPHPLPAPIPPPPAVQRPVAGTVAEVEAALIDEVQRNVSLRAENLERFREVRAGRANADRNSRLVFDLTPLDPTGDEITRDEVLLYDLAFKTTHELLAYDRDGKVVGYSSITWERTEGGAVRAVPVGGDAGKEWGTVSGTLKRAERTLGYSHAFRLRDHEGYVVYTGTVDGKTGPAIRVNCE